MGHGVDARHAGVHGERPCAQEVPSQPPTFRLLYAYHENFVLPLSHDEVVHGKGSLLRKCRADRLAEGCESQAAFWGTCTPSPARSSFSWEGEFGQWNEWYHDVASTGSAGLSTTQKPSALAVRTSTDCTGRGSPAHSGLLILRV